MTNLEIFTPEVISLAQKVAAMRDEDLSVTMMTALEQLESYTRSNVSIKRDMSKTRQLIKMSGAYIRENNINMTIEELYDNETGLPK